LIQTARYPEFKYNDVLSMNGGIRNPHDIKTVNNFNYGRYLLHQNIHGLVKNPENLAISHLSIPSTKWGKIQVGIFKIIYQIGDKFEQTINKILPEPFAAFQNGLILGNRAVQMPDSLTSQVNRTGTTHIVAVSGFNVTIIVSVVAILLAGFSRRLAFWGTLVLITFFIIMTGAAASIIRAGLLGGLAGWGKLEGRRVNHTILILIVAFIMLLFNPYQLKSDISFQLSFLAFAGLVYVSPAIDGWRFWPKIPKIIKTTLTETLGAQTLVLPILVYNFGLLSIVSPLANVLILPTIPFAMLLGFITGIGGMISLWLGKVAGLVAWLLLKYTIIVIEFLSKIPFASVSVKTNEWWWIPVYYIVVVIFINRNQNFKNQKSK
jgi:competence protein ComEC